MDIKNGKRGLKHIAICIIPLLLTACFETIRYFQPTPNREFEFIDSAYRPVYLQQNQNVQMFLIVFEQFIRFEFPLPEGETLKWINPNFTIHPPNGNSIHLPIEAIDQVSFGGYKYGVKDELIGVTQKGHDKILRHKRLNIEVPMPDTGLETFELELPTFYLTDKKITFKNIQYTKKRGIEYIGRP